MNVNRYYRYFIAELINSFIALLIDFILKIGWSNDLLKVPFCSSPEVDNLKIWQIDFGKVYLPHL